jgi:hypothetical protein
MLMHSKGYGHRKRNMVDCLRERSAHWPHWCRRNAPGSFTTYLFQSRTAKHNQEFQREREDWQEQLNSCSAFAGALTELRQREIALWFQRQRDPRGAETQKMATECDRAGASAETARLRVELVSGAPDLMTLADSAFDALEPIRSAAFGEGEPVKDLDELREHETSFETALKEFLQAARAQLRPAGSP